MAKLKFKPIGDRILIKIDKEADQKTASGIYVPDSSRQEKPDFGTIIAAGEGKRTEAGKTIPMRVKVGQTIMFAKFSYDEIKIDGEEYLVISENNILGILG